MRERSQSFDPRQIMQGNSFEVFHYREPKPGNVEVHHHDFYEVYYLLGGRVEYWVEGQILRLEPGDILLIDPQSLHRPIVDPESPMYERFVLWIHREYLAEELCRCFAPGMPHRLRPQPREGAALRTLLAELVRESYSREYGADLYAQGLFLQLMVKLNRQASGEAPEVPEKQLSPLTQKAVVCITEDVSRAWSLEEIAEKCYVSKYHLSHTFRQEMGISVYRYGMLRRLLAARQMLLAGEPASRVAAACGFSDYAGFYRAFRAEYGISPKETLTDTI